MTEYMQIHKDLKGVNMLDVTLNGEVYRVVIHDIYCSQDISPLVSVEFVGYPERARFGVFVLNTELKQLNELGTDNIDPHTALLWGNMPQPASLFGGVLRPTRLSASTDTVRYDSVVRVQITKHRWVGVFEKTDRKTGKSTWHVCPDCSDGDGVSSNKKATVTKIRR